MALHRTARSYHIIMSSFDSPPEYDIHLDRVKEIETACALSVEIKKQLGKLADPVIKLEDTLGDAIDTAAVERIRNNLLTLPSVCTTPLTTTALLMYFKTYASALIPVQKFSVDLRIGCESMWHGERCQPIDVHKNKKSSFR